MYVKRIFIFSPGLTTHADFTVYVGSFLAMLNARHRPSNKAPGHSDIENGSHIKLTTPTRTQNSRWEFRVQTTVQTETFTESDIDPYSPQTDLERSGLSRTTTYAVSLHLHSLEQAPVTLLAFLFYPELPI